MNGYIGIDDTDGKDRGIRGSGKGTGRLARKVAERLADFVKVKGIVRHQLPKISTINYTANNSSKSIIVDFGKYPSKEDVEKVIEVTVSTVKEFSLKGSNSGVALLLGDVSEEAKRLANRIKREKVEKEEVLKVTKSSKIRLIEVLGTGEGIIGAFAAAVLAADGNDGRFLALEDGKVFSGLLNVGEVLRLGVSSIKSVNGMPIPADDFVLINELKPRLKDGKPVLYVRQVGWLTVLFEGLKRAVKEAMNVRKRGRVWLPVKVG